MVKETDRLERGRECHSSSVVVNETENGRGFTMTEIEGPESVFNRKKKEIEGENVRSAE